MRPPTEQLCPHLPRGPPRSAPNDRPIAGGDRSPARQPRCGRLPHNPVNQPRQNPKARHRAGLSHAQGRNHVKPRPSTAITAVASVVSAAHITVAPTTLLLLVGLFLSLLVAVGCTLRWYVKLTPRQRTDVIAFIRALRCR
jgi:hypothetical protein